MTGARVFARLAPDKTACRDDRHRQPTPVTENIGEIENRKFVVFI